MASRRYVWSAFALGALLVAVALAWLSRHAIESERAQRQTQAAAEIEERAGRALWRIDSLFTPLIVREVGRPTLMEPGGDLAPVSASETIASRFFEVNDKDNSWCKDAATNCAVASSADFVALWTAMPVEETRGFDVVDSIEASTQIAQNAVPNNFAQTAAPALPDAQFESEPTPNGQGARQGTNEPQLKGGVNTIANDKRAQKDLRNRGQAYEQYAQSLNTVRGDALEPRSLPIAEGPVQAQWIGDELVLGRRAVHRDRRAVHGCVLDWPRLQAMAAAEVADLFPDATLIPVKSKQDFDALAGRMLATLPVALAFSPETTSANGWTPAWTAVAVTWTSYLVAIVAGGWTLASILALSERRAAFVSAVTHELRTPLTTFRMYAEMLASDMVPDATSRKQYLTTLQTEAERLTHLVENVLLYARLERSDPDQRRVATTVAATLARCEERLENRARQAAMAWSVDCSDEMENVPLTTDPAAVEQILFNLVDNASKYGRGGSVAGTIQLAARVDGPWVVFSVRDDGPGVSPTAARKLFIPFSRSAEEASGGQPGVGLGLALSRRLATALRGRLDYRREGASTVFELRLPLSRENATDADRGQSPGPGR